MLLKAIAQRFFRAATKNGEEEWLSPNAAPPLANASLLATANTTTNAPTAQHVVDDISDLELDVEAPDDEDLAEGGSFSEGWASAQDDLTPVAGPALRESSLIAADRSERRAFVMHENLLRDVIQRQAGSLSKAVLEGVMNLIEASATRGTITVTAGRIVIADDGRGFASRDEVLEAFEVFGKSDARRAIAGRWAEFQMGRGQLMAFGRTTYRTRSFAMATDIGAASEVAVGYVLHQDLEDVPGCIVTVDLYENLEPYEIADLVKDVGRVIRYVDVPIEVNGTVVTVDPASEKWTFEDENAYYRVRGLSDGLELYNLGVFVSELHHWGTGGVIVSKKRLTLNFARNDVIASCPVWKAILGEFKARTRHALLEKKAPTVKDVRLIVQELDRGRFELEQVARVPLLRDTNGRRLSLSELTRRCAPHLRRPDSVEFLEAFSLDYANSTKADYAMESRTWLFLDAEFVAQAFDAAETPLDFDDLGDLSVLLTRVAALQFDGATWVGGDRDVRGRFVPRDELYAQLSFAHAILPDEKLTRDESGVMTALRRENRYIASACSEAPRLLLVGIDDGAEAWTDGKRIVIERSFLRRCLRVPHGLLRMLHVLAHEYTHNNEDLVHGPEFDRRFHEAIMRIGPAHTRILSSLLNVGTSRLSSFRKPAAQAVEAARRLARDAANHRSGAILPCPGCAAIGPRLQALARQTEGVAIDTLIEATSSDEAFNRVFGSGFSKPRTWRSGTLVECPICNQALHDVDAFKATSREQIRRVCELAVTSAGAGALTPIEARALAKAGAAASARSHPL